MVTQTLVSRLEITDLRYDITCYGDFLRHIPARLGRNEALDASADALATTFSTLHRPQGYQTVDALTKYVKAISSLRLCLEDPAKARMPETMCSVYLIMICQVSESVSDLNSDCVDSFRAGWEEMMIRRRVTAKVWHIFLKQRRERIGKPVSKQTCS
jgi:flagellin-specific chaperone FliS